MSRQSESKSLGSYFKEHNKPLYFRVSAKSEPKLNQNENKTYKLKKAVFAI